MNILTTYGLVGDEDDSYLDYRYIKAFLQQELYKAMYSHTRVQDSYYTFRYPGVIHCVSGTTEIV